MMDNEDAKLLDAWKLLESNGLGNEWKEGSTLSAPEDTTAERFKNLLTINDNGVDVEILFGWLPIANIEEIFGNWVVSVRNKEISSHRSREEALDELFKYMRDDDE
jgi:hypothetical protein